MSVAFINRLGPHAGPGDLIWPPFDRATPTDPPLAAHQEMESAVREARPWMDGGGRQAVRGAEAEGRAEPDISEAERRPAAALAQQGGSPNVRASQGF